MLYRVNLLISFTHQNCQSFLFVIVSFMVKCHVDCICKRQESDSFPSSEVTSALPWGIVSTTTTPDLPQSQKRRRIRVALCKCCYHIVNFYHSCGAAWSGWAVQPHRDAWLGMELWGCQPVSLLLKVLRCGGRIFIFFFSKLLSFPSQFPSTLAVL